MYNKFLKSGLNSCVTFITSVHYVPYLTPGTLMQSEVMMRSDPVSCSAIMSGRVIDLEMVPVVKKEVT